MQHDEVIWQIIRHNHCSYMSKIETGNFCRNPYNVTGVCNRSSCPLANSRYATIRNHDGVFYLYMKTVERAHMPNKLWERLKLPANILEALEIIDKHMMYWPKLLLLKVKQRLAKMCKTRKLMKHLAGKTREKIITEPRKRTLKDARNLDKAEKAAMIDKKIEDELLERLQRDLPRMSNYYDEKLWEEYLKANEVEESDEEPVVEYVEDYEELEEEDDIEDFGNLAMNDSNAGKVGLDEDDEDTRVTDRMRGSQVSKLALKMNEKDEPLCKSTKKVKVLIEVEHEYAGKRDNAVQRY